MSKHLSNKEYESLGRIMAQVYESGYLNAAQTYKMSFLKGMAGGLGGVIGATIFVALIVWLLSLFDSVPLVGPIVDNLRDTINQTTQ